MWHKHVVASDKVAVNIVHDFYGLYRLASIKDSLQEPKHWRWTYSLTATLAKWRFIWIFTEWTSIGIFTRVKYKILKMFLCLLTFWFQWAWETVFLCRHQAMEATISFDSSLTKSLQSIARKQCSHSHEIFGYLVSKLVSRIYDFPNSQSKLFQARPPIFFRRTSCC